MENGKTISKTMQKLQEVDKEWELHLLDGGAEMGDEVSELVDRLFTAVRQELKTGSKTNVRARLLEEQMSEETADKFIRDIQETLEFYSGFSFLRDIEENNELELRGLLSIIFQKYIIRFEPGYMNRLINTTYDGKELIRVANQMKYLTDYYISRSYSVQGIIRDLQDETGLMEENCAYWADMIEQNYRGLKMDYLIRELERANESVIP